MDVNELVDGLPVQEGEFSYGVRVKWTPVLSDLEAILGQTGYTRVQHLNLWVKLREGKGQIGEMSHISFNSLDLVDGRVMQVSQTIVDLYTNSTLMYVDTLTYVPEMFI